MTGPELVLFAWAYAWQLAYDTGRAHERERIGESLAELDAIRALVPRDRRIRTWEEQVADRMALYERLATAGHEQRGTRPWPGLDAMEPAQRAAAYRALLDTWRLRTERRAA
jgi:hypothetical protein